MSVLTDFHEHSERGRDGIQMIPHFRGQIVQILLDGRILELS